VFAQLRDVLATKDSSIVPQENEDSGLFVPQRSEPDFPAVAIGERYESQFVAKRIVHGASSSAASHAVSSGQNFLAAMMHRISLLCFVSFYRPTRKLRHPSPGAIIQTYNAD
jgi:hypothetical protein